MSSSIKKKIMTIGSVVSEIIGFKGLHWFSFSNLYNRCIYIYISITGYFNYYNVILATQIKVIIEIKLDEKYVIIYKLYNIF